MSVFLVSCYCRIDQKKFLIKLPPVKSHDRKHSKHWPAGGAVSLWFCARSLLAQVALAANDTQLVLVGRGQIHGAGRDGGTQVTRVGDVQVCVRVWPEHTQHSVQRLQQTSRTKPKQYTGRQFYPSAEWLWTSMTSRELKYVTNRYGSLYAVEKHRIWS